jgi:hypothetical protein
VRETGPVGRRLSSLQGRGGDYETEIRYQAIARTILGSLKNQLRLGDVQVGALRKVLADGTEIIVSTVMGAGGAADIDSIDIRRAISREIPISPKVEREKKKINIPGGPRLLALFAYRPPSFVYATNFVVAIDLETHSQEVIYQFVDVQSANATRAIAAGAAGFSLSGFNGYPIESGYVTFFDRAWTQINTFLAEDEDLRSSVYIAGQFIIAGLGFFGRNDSVMTHIYAFDDHGTLQKTVDMGSMDVYEFGDYGADGMAVDTDAELDAEGNLTGESFFVNFRNDFSSLISERDVNTLGVLNSFSVDFSQYYGSNLSGAGLAASRDSLYTIDSSAITYAVAPDAINKLSRDSGQVIARFKFPDYPDEGWSNLYPYGNSIAYYNDRVYAPSFGAGTIHVFDGNLNLVDKIVLDSAIADHNESQCMSVTIDFYERTSIESDE